MSFVGSSYPQSSKPGPTSRPTSCRKASGALPAASAPPALSRTGPGPHRPSPSTGITQGRRQPEPDSVGTVRVGPSSRAPTSWSQTGLAKTSSSPTGQESCARRGKNNSRGDVGPPDPILFQTYFQSVGPRTYAAQLKRARNGNQFLVFTEGRRDKVTDEVRKTSLYVFSEDFASFFRMLKETAEFIKAHPLPKDIAEKRKKFWQKESEARPAPAASPGGRSRHQ